MNRFRHCEARESRQLEFMDCFTSFAMTKGFDNLWEGRLGPMAFGTLWEGRPGPMAVGGNRGEAPNRGAGFVIAKRHCQDELAST